MDCWSGRLFHVLTAAERSLRRWKRWSEGQGLHGLLRGRLTSSPHMTWTQTNSWTDTIASQSLHSSLFGQWGHCTLACHSFIHSFLTYTTRSAWCERFWATSIASFSERLLDFRSCWIVFIHVVRGCPGGLLQFSKEKLLRCYRHLFHLAFTQCGWIGRNADHRNT